MSKFERLTEIFAKKMCKSKEIGNLTCQSKLWHQVENGSGIAQRNVMNRHRFMKTRQGLGSQMAMFKKIWRL